MKKSEILETLNGVFVDILDNVDIVLTCETKAIDIKDWDSLNHIQMVVAVEKRFNTRFSSKEIQYWITIGDIVNSISLRIN